MIKKEFLSIFKSALKFKAKNPLWLNQGLRPGFCRLSQLLSYLQIRKKTAHITQTESSSFSVF